MRRISKGKLAKAKFFAFGLAAGVVVGIIGFVFLQNYNPPDEPTQKLEASVVFDRIVSKNEMVSAVQNYSIVDKVTDSNTFFDLFEIPFTNNSFWYRYNGTIKAGVNLETAACEINGNVLTLTLDRPYIISNTPDMDTSGALEETNNVLNPIHVEDVDAFQRQCIERSAQEASEGGLLEEARAKAEENLREMFYVALGDEYTIEFAYRDGDQ